MQKSVRSKQAVGSKQTIEPCERTSARMSEWHITYIPILSFIKPPLDAVVAWHTSRLNVMLVEDFR